MGETNSPSVARVGYDISPLSKVKFNSLEWRNIVTHGQLRENLCLLHSDSDLLLLSFNATSDQKK